jgi:hypothetical protein
MRQFRKRFSNGEPGRTRTYDNGFDIIEAEEHFSILHFILH